jgi:oxygen-dependent protoporphyrinogen oxidase
VPAHLLRSAVVLKAASTSAPTVETPLESSVVYDAVIVGAGISGLVTALALDTKHSDNVQSILVTEARERVGGNITSCSDGEYLWEEGPNSFQPSDSVLEAAVCNHDNHQDYQQYRLHICRPTMCAKMHFTNAFLFFTWL